MLRSPLTPVTLRAGFPVLALIALMSVSAGPVPAADRVRTAEAPGSLSISADSTAIRNDGLDLSFVTVTVTDARGVSVPQSDNRIRLSIEGPGEIVATDNGDPVSFEPFPSHERAAFNGRVLAIVRGVKGKAGAVKLTAESPGLRSAVLNLRTVAESAREPDAASANRRLAARP